MAAVTFKRYIYRERKAEFPNRRTLTPFGGMENTFTVQRNEGIIQQEGDQWAPEVMTGLEDRIEASVNGLDKKVDDDIASAKSTLNASIALKANIASPALTGTPTAPTAAVGTNSSQLATTEFVTTADLNVRSIKATVTVTTASWEIVTDNGQAVYRKSTGVTGNATDVPILGLPPGQIKQLTSSPSLVNIDGMIYIYSAQIPNISLTVTVTKLQSR